MRDEHNHSLNAAETLRYLPATNCRDTYIKYFESGMKVSKALKHHRELLKLRDDITEEDMANSRINPTNRTVHHWHWVWRFPNLKPKKKVKVNDHSNVDDDIVKQSDEEKTKQSDCQGILSENAIQLEDGKANKSYETKQSCVPQSILSENSEQLEDSKGKESEDGQFLNSSEGISCIKLYS